MLQVDFNVLNRQGTPVLMAENLDSIGFPNTAAVGTLLIDTYVPSSGIWRYVGGGSWEQVAVGAMAVSTPTLQQVTNVGNDTYNPITFNYSDSYAENSIFFYNADIGSTEYEITKKANGIGANDILSIASIGGSNSVGIAIDKTYSSINTYKGFYNFYGLRIDLANKFFSLGDWAGGFGSTFLTVNDAAGYIEFSTNQRFATAGGSSGQHLRIRIGSTFYKIALLNN